MPDQEIPKTYNAKDWESKLYAQWDESALFSPDTTDSSERYSNILPPPNANGELHLGHASGYTVMDIFGRFERMKGKKTLLLPGKDHAGIQTQVVFEKKLKADRNIDRYELGREKFFEESYAFCMDRANYMRSQEKRIGLSADWSREKFTLDPEVSRRAAETFVKMYEDGMIYRGERIINWCPRCATALSDIEVIHQEIPGKLFFIKYPIKDPQDSIQFITVATTRPETMLGDTAVAVHPEDTRYQNLIGKTILLPLTGREIPVIGDERIDPIFGTGAVKITPAHDPLDWEIGKTHKLEAIQTINKEAKIVNSTEFSKYADLSVKDARERILADLVDLNLLEKEENHTINLSRCERCKTAIEPLISKQWFINVDAPNYSIKQKTLETLRSDAIIFHPENFRDDMIRWIENLHDWCISRQIWWGHRIPVWYCNRCGKDSYIVSIEKPDFCPKCQNLILIQDEDTLDTWFSSGQWPYTTLGYPEGSDAKQFYPTDIMITGRDLLFFWASRMVMFGLYRTGVAPFKHLYLTGLVRDKEGQKMSKSKGNGVDVLEMIEKFGADAVRLSLTLGTTPGLDFRLYEEKIETFRNFANKLWNIGRYVISQDTSSKTQDTNEEPLKAITDADHWILSRLQETIEEVTRLLENYQLSLAGEKLRDFTWNEFADWYVEIHKVEKNDTVLRHVFETLLKLWHPFIPFVTEAIWETFGNQEKNLLMVEKWPSHSSTSNVAGKPITEKSIGSPEADTFRQLITLIQEIRAIKSLYRIDPATKLDITIQENSREIIESNAALLKRLARIENIHYSEELPQHTILAQSGSLQTFIELEGVIDFEAEKKRLEKEIADKEKYITSIETKLSNRNFIERAKPEVVFAEREKLEMTRKELAEIESHLTSLL